MDQAQVPWKGAPERSKSQNPEPSFWESKQLKECESEAVRELSRTGSKHDGIEARRKNPKLGENPNFGITKSLRKPEAREIFLKDIRHHL
ncbi:hypothetical protein YC2023_108488 [Brassica napus]